MRFQHGELHLAILALLSQRPLHGYELMSELSTRMGRRYKASPGSIYPAVQSLEAEGLILGNEDGDRRTFALTDGGRAALENRADRLPAMESRLGVRFANGVEPDLARFAQRVRAVAPRLDETVIAGALDVAASEIERMAEDRSSDRRRRS
jgi:DNA-binding PadR family transcriptional regulator